MTRAQAIQWVRDHSDQDDLDQDDLDAAFASLFGREPDNEDIDAGLWSLCCAAVEPTRKGRAMKTIEYQNTFHSTTARVRVAEEDISDGGECGLMVKLSASQIRRVEKTLCGMSDCHCGSHQNFTSFLGEKDRFGRVWCGGGRIA